MTNGGMSPWGSSAVPEPLEMKRELIVVAKRDAELNTHHGEVMSVRGVNVSSLQYLLDTEGVTLTPLFGTSETQLRREAMAMAAATDGAIQDLSIYYHVDAPDNQLDELAHQFQQQEIIETAYVKPAAELAIAPPLTRSDSPSETIRPIDDLALAATPDFTAQQGYIEAAPGGIDARYAWTFPGGRGANVNIIDLEWGWRFTHEDLRQNQGGVLAGNNSSVLRQENHGTAVIGVLGGDRNSFGITGICPDAQVSAISFTTIPTARAIRQAADRLRPGDIMLLEIHRPGPRHNFATRDDQQGYVAIEWWPDDYEAIRYAINRGILVVEAAGNGQENLDDAIYDRQPNFPFGPFPNWWSNPYRRNALDSGAIVVGAGAPPPGTHGRSFAPDRSRLDFSNFGALIDAQGWGAAVLTTGYNDLWRDPDAPDNRDRWYTDGFGGTSSASPIVVGALACVQGVLRAKGRVPLSPARSRELLRATGTPQQDVVGRPSSQRIGTRPNLRQLIDRALETASWVGVQFTGTVPAKQTRQWFTHRWPAHWQVLWTVVPTNPLPGAPQIKWNVEIERASDRHITYWISVTNVSNTTASIEGRFAVLGW